MPTGIVDPSATVYPTQGFEVRYMVNESGVIVTKAFKSEHECVVFINKLKHSKKCTLVSCVH